MDIAVEFRELIAALNKAGVEYAMCGGRQRGFDHFEKQEDRA